MDVIEVKRLIKTHPETNSFLTLLDKYIQQMYFIFNQGLSSTCPEIDTTSISDVSYKITNLIKNTYDTEVIKSIVQKMIEGRPAHVYSRSMIQMFLKTLGITASADEFDLLKRIFRTYGFYAFYLMFKKRLPLCDPNTMQTTLKVISGKSELKRYNLDYPKLIMDKTEYYHNNFIKPYLGKDFENLLKSIVKAMDYYKNSVNILISSFANYYYKVKEEQSKQLTSEKTSVSISLLPMKLSIKITAKKYFKSVNLINHYAPGFLRKEPIYKLMDKLSEDDKFLDGLFIEVNRIVTYLQADTCSNEWINQLQLVTIRKSEGFKSFKQLVLDTALNYLKEIDKEFYDKVSKHHYYKVELRKLILKIYLKAVIDSVCG